MRKIIDLIKKYSDIVTYLLFGVLTTAVNYIVFVLCCDLFQMSATVGNIIAWVVAVLFAFVTNKPFVFKSYDWSLKVTLPEFVKFVVGRLGSGIFETLFLFVTVDYMGWNAKIFKLIVSVVVVIVNYVLSKFFAFKNK